jgi:putative ABC transport system ATP-binding protein
MVAVATSATTALASCVDLGVSHGSGDTRVDALREVSLEVAGGSTLALWGRSGSGKTTLLHALGGLVEPTEGVVWWRGTKLSTLDARARAQARASGIAYVFQGSNLLPHFTALENIAFARRLAGDASVPEPADLLALVGLGAKSDSLPSELSGGEAQRVAVARALAQAPALLLCDEPTGHLDSDTGVRVLDLIEAAQREFSFALVLATHDPRVADRCERQVELDDGRVRLRDGAR